MLFSIHPVSQIIQVATMRILASCIIIALLSCPVLAQESSDLNDLPAADLYGTARTYKFENTDEAAPWNDPLMRDDPFAPWNDTLLKSDYSAPWNTSWSGAQDTNAYLRAQGVTNPEYYWKQEGTGGAGQDRNRP